MMINKNFLILMMFALNIHLFFAQGNSNYNFNPDFKYRYQTTSKISPLVSSYRLDSLKNENQNTDNKKSPGAAFLYSLLLPGTGQLYAKRFDVGKYYMISEAALWLGFASFSIYGNWLHTDAHKFAAMHAGINPNINDDNFYVNISNYDNIYEYNDDQLRNGNYSGLYDQNAYYFYWDNTADREKYRTDQLTADQVINDRLFLVGAIVVNHIISAISAIILTNSYNDQLGGTKGGFAINADVIRYGPWIDGIQLKFTKWF